MDLVKVSKLKRYISENRPHKFKSYVRKHRVQLSHIVLNKNRNLLHYCCKHGAGIVMKWLISEGVDGTIVDSDLCTPLHLALERCLKLEDNGQHDDTTLCYNEMILPLVQRFPACMDMKNKAGFSCRQLLHQLVKKREQSEDSETEDDDQYKGQEHNSFDETSWRDKLAAEWQDEYQTTWGNYEPDYTNYSEKNEAYDDWADKIREEYYTKKRAQSAYHNTQRPTQRGKRKHSESKTEEQEKLEEARAKMRKRFDEHKEKDREMNILKKRMKYEERYRKLLESDKKLVLKFEDIPWPSEKEQKYDIEVLFDGMDKSGSGYKKYLRDQQVRWHPDKFMQRFGHVLDDSEKDKILQRVTVLSQNLNKLVT